MNKNKYLIFCDFDGTIANEDVGYRLFHHFSDGRNDALIPEWQAGRISSREILTLEAQMVSATKSEVLKYVDQFELDSGFADFVALCRSSGIEPVIISEGMEFYISYLLKKNGLGDLEVLSNIGNFEGNKLTMEFPHQNSNCRRCGSCKGERIAEFREKQDQPVKVVFLGDGYSDACAAKEADILLAKKDLVTYCQDNNIKFEKFGDFRQAADLLIEIGILKQTPKHQSRS